MTPSVRHYVTGTITLFNPVHYQWKCMVCSIGISSHNYSNFRACSEPEVFQGTFRNVQILRVAHDKVCMGCYRHSLVISKISKDNPISNDQDFHTLLSAIQNTVPRLPFSITNNYQLLDIATKFTVIHVTQELLSNHTLSLRDAYHTFESQMDTLIPMSTLTGRPEKVGTELLSQLCSSLQHHLAYTCRVKKHGVFLYRQGK